MSAYLKEIEAVERLREAQGEAWNGINPESAVTNEVAKSLQDRP